MYINSSNSVLWNSNIDSMDLLQGLSAFFKLLIKYWPRVNVIFLLLLPLTSRGSIDEFSKQNVFYIRKKGRYILESKVNSFSWEKKSHYSLPLHYLKTFCNSSSHDNNLSYKYMSSIPRAWQDDWKPSEVDAWCP